MRPVSPAAPGIRAKSPEGAAPAVPVTAPETKYQENKYLSRPESPTIIYEPRKLGFPLLSLASMHDFKTQMKTGLTISKGKAEANFADF